MPQDQRIPFLKKSTLLSLLRCHESDGPSDMCGNCRPFLFVSADPSCLRVKCSGMNHGQAEERGSVGGAETERCPAVIRLVAGLDPLRDGR